jgi:hypothetical protein
VCAGFAIVLMTACGSSGEDSKSPTEILQDTANAIRSVHSYHLSGSVTSSGGQQMSLDVRVANAQTIAGSIAERGVTAHLVVIGSTFYLQGKQFFALFGTPAAANLVGDRWVKLSTSAASGLQSGISSFADTKKLADCLAGGARAGHLSKSTSTLNGRQVVELRAGSDVLDVADSGSPYPVRLSGSGSGGFLNNSPSCSSGGGSGGGSGTLNFDSWGANVQVTPPPKPLDLSQIASG